LSDWGCAEVAEIFSGFDYGKLKDLLSRILEVSEDSGTATGGSDTTVVDSGKNWTTDMWKNATVHVIHLGVEYVRTCSGNTADTLTIATLPAGISVVAGDDYAIRRPITVSDISKWGGTALTGRDISNDLAKLDVALSTRLADTKIPNAIPQEETTNEPKISINKDNVGLAKSTDISATQPRNIAQVSGTAQTGRDWSSDFAKLQNIDILLSALRDALLAGTATYPGGLDDIYNKLNSQLDVLLSTRLADSKIPNAIPQEETTNEPKISINKDNVGLAKSTDISATQPRNIAQVGGTAQTARDWSGDLAKLQNLDALLSTRATETTLAKIVPIAKAALFNTALPTAESNWLASNITPTNSPSYLRIYVCVSVAGILRVARTVSATTITENLNSGNSLTADAAYMFDVAWRSGDSINIRYSVTTGTIKILRIEEIGAAV
jgi:hypothetical protein